MSPGALSKAAAGLASVEGLTSGRAAVFLSICAQTGKDGTCFISQGKLGKRCGITRKHAHDSVAWLIEKGTMPGQRIAKLADVAEDDCPYFAIVLVHGQGRRPEAAE